MNDAPIRAPQLPTDAPLAQFGGGQSAANVAGTAVGIGRDIQQQAFDERRKAYAEAVQVETLHAANAIAAEDLRIRQQLSQVKGRDAQKAAGSVLGDFEKFYSNLEKGIQNDDVRRRANQEYQQRQLSLNDWSNRYASSEMETYEKNEFQSFMKIQRESAAVDPSPANVAVASMGQKLAIREYAGLKGLGENWVKEHEQEAASATYTNALKTLLTSGNDIAAKNFYDINKGEFVGADAIYAKGAVEEQSSIGEAYRISDSIFAQKQPPESMDDVRKVTEKIESANVRKMAESFSKTRLAEREAAAAAAYEANLRAAEQQVMKTGSIKGIPYGLRGQHFKQLVDLADMVRTGEKPTMTTDKWAKYNEYRDWAAAPETRGKFLAVDPMELRLAFPDEQYNALRSIRDGLLKDDKQTKIKLDGYRANTDIINGSLERAGIVHPKQSKAEKFEEEQFKRIMDEQYQLYKIREKKEPDNKWVQETADQLLEWRATEDKWYWFEQKERAYWLVDKELSRQLSDVPAADRAKIEAALQQMGEPVTRATVIEWYMRQQAKIEQAKATSSTK